MVTFYELHNTDLASLDAFAADFERLVRRWDLGESLNSGVLATLRGTNWRGDAATSAAAAINGIRTQIDAAFDEAGALAVALRDAHTEFLAAQQDLSRALQEAADHAMTVDGSGTVQWEAKGNPDDPDATAYAKSAKQNADLVKQAIDAAVARATEADNAMVAALSADTGSSTSSFNSAPLGGISEIEAQQAADLMRLGDKATDAQVAQLDALLKAHHDDPRFATAFYTSLGPEGFLKDLGRLDQGPGLMQGPRSGMLTDLQGDLGLTLATATRSGNQPHLSDDWEAGLRKAGATQYSLSTGSPPGGRPYGYQILSNVLRTGQYDPHFLTPVAEHITQLTEADPGRWNEATALSGLVHRDGLGSGDGGYNPMSGVLEALGHSPDAALQYFHDPATLYNPDGTVLRTGAENHYLHELTDPKSGVLQDVLLSKNDAPGGVAPDEATSLGHALEAATTGAAWDAPPDVALPPHSGAMNDLTSQVVSTFGHQNGPDLIHGDGAPFAPLNGSLGHMVAAHVADAQQAIAGGPSGPQQSHTPGAPLNSADTLRLVAALGRDPEAYASVLHAQQAYTAAQIHDVLLQNPGHGDLLAEAVRNTAQPGGVMAGVLNGGRVDEVYHTHQISDAAYNAKIDERAEWATKAWDLSAGKEAAKAPVLGDYVNKQADEMIQNIAGKYRIDSTNMARDQTASILETWGSVESAKAAVRAAAVGTSLDAQTVQTLADSAATSAQSGYGVGYGTLYQGVSRGAGGAGQA
ncbi:hypothetical protein ACFW1A_16640 [Kitasatospora sp. NPDC058965]|uniref:hypothetical protein n=1 Tax=Kitasatospora sp. NPDC058965 TaxID=3346682 RepID=UPI0036B12BCF